MHITAHKTVQTGQNIGSYDALESLSYLLGFLVCIPGSVSSSIVNVITDNRKDQEMYLVLKVKYSQLRIELNTETP